MEPPARTAKGRSRCSSPSACSRSSRRSAASSGSPASGSPWRSCSRPRPSQLVHPSATEDYLTSLVAVAIAVVGSLVAWRVTKAGRELVTTGALRTALERKLYFDELYDAVFSRPVQAVALRLRDDVEGPIVHRSLDEIARGSLEAGGSVARAQSGLLRIYALVIAASVVVLAIVFLVVR